jgi:hypothetical protein
MDLSCSGFLILNFSPAQTFSGVYVPDPSPQSKSTTRRVIASREELLDESFYVFLWMSAYSQDL